MGIRGRAFMVNAAFVKQFGISLDHETVARTTAEYAARMKQSEKEMRREQQKQELYEVVRRNHPVALAFYDVCQMCISDKLKLERLIVLARDKKDKVKLPPNLSLAHYVFTSARKNRPRSVGAKLEKCSKMIDTVLRHYRQLQDHGVV